MVKHDVAFQLDRLRREKGLTQIDVAFQIGTSTGTIMLVGKGILPGRMAVIEAYAQAVGADVVDIRKALMASLPTLREARHHLVKDLDDALASTKPRQMTNVHRIKTAR